MGELDDAGRRISRPVKPASPTGRTRSTPLETSALSRYLGAMAKKPIDAEFKFVAHPFRIRTGDVLWYVFWVGGYALAAYAINDRAASAVLVVIAGLAWPVRRFLASLKREVPEEQADWIADKAKRSVYASDRKPARSRKRLAYNPGATL